MLMFNVIKIAPYDTVLITIGNDVDLDEYKAIADRFIEKLHTQNVVLMPEYAIKDFDYENINNIISNFKLIKS